ncbi:MAG: hypothetical protein MJ078_05710, partial [Clostridia bacterium]|nr:hypothetical protein [Clostridia bacterium]
MEAVKETEKKYPLVEAIASPRDVRLLSEDKVPALCGEIRQFLEDKVGKTGGHFASNLG